MKLNLFLAINSFEDIILNNGDNEDNEVVFEGFKYYPIDWSIPLIFIDKKRCVGLVKINEVHLYDNKTLIKFKMIQAFDKYYKSADIYYNSYIEFLKNNKEEK